MKRIVTALLAAVAIFLGLTASAQAGGNNSVYNSQYSYTKVLVSHSDGVGRYLQPGIQTDTASSYYVLSGTHVYDYYAGRCYAAGSRVYLYNGTLVRNIRVYSGSAC